jgi:AraC family transcriptional regulator of adaptative response/methylated-DNA-[protein]-cysteine methyltransferase
MPPLRFARVETSLGPMWVVETDRGVAAVDRATSLDAFLEPLRRRFPDADPVPANLDAAWLTNALRGGPLPAVDLRGLSDFDARVYEAVRSVPSGETVTYGEVAAIVGSPGGARAVGGAMSRCPLFPAVPCHRVVRASDGWSGWGGDDRLKRRLLNAEAEASLGMSGQR